MPGVIKAEMVAGGPSAGLKAFRLDELTREAEEAIAAARRQSRQIIAAAEAQAQSLRESASRDSADIREAARREGFERGWAEAIEKVRQEGRPQILEEARREFSDRQAGLVAACQSLLQSLETSRAEWMAAAHHDLVELALAIARRVARHVGNREREVVLANLEEAVRLVGARGEMTIAVNPIDAEAARLFAGSLLDLKEHWEHIHIVEESEISPGGCRVRWGSGSIDAALETQLDRIAAELEGA